MLSAIRRTWPFGSSCSRTRVMSLEASPLFFHTPLRLKFRPQQEPEPKFSAGMRVAEIFGQVHSSAMALSEILDLSGNLGPSEIFGRPHEPA